MMKGHSFYYDYRSFKLIKSMDEMIFFLPTQLSVANFILMRIL